MLPRLISNTQWFLLILHTRGKIHILMLLCRLVWAAPHRGYQTELLMGEYESRELCAFGCFLVLSIQAFSPCRLQQRDRVLACLFAKNRKLQKYKCWIYFMDYGFMVYRPLRFFLFIFPVQSDNTFILHVHFHSLSRGIEAVYPPFCISLDASGIIASYRTYMYARTYNCQTESHYRVAPINLEMGIHFFDEKQN